jgi:hypothetical protein
MNYFILKMTEMTKPNEKSIVYIIDLSKNTPPQPDARGEASRPYRVAA